MAYLAGKIALALMGKRNKEAFDAEIKDMGPGKKGKGKR